MSKILLLIGDSNVRRWIPRLCATYQQLVSFAPAHNRDELPSALAQVNNSYQMVVFAGLSNILSTAGAEAQNNVDRLEKLEVAISDVIGLLR